MQPPPIAEDSAGTKEVPVLSEIASATEEKEDGEAKVSGGKVGMPLQLIQKLGASVFQKVQYGLEAGRPSVVGVGHFLHSIGDIGAKGLDLGFEFGAWSERGKFREVEVVHGEKKKRFLKVLVRHHPGRAAERKVASSGGFLHAGVGRVAVVLTYGSGGITGNLFLKSALLEQLAKSCLGGRRATNVSPTDKKDMHALLSTFWAFWVQGRTSLERGQT